MSEVTISLLVLMPIWVAALATVLLARTSSQKLLFAVSSALSLLGVQSFASPAAVGIFLPGSAGLAAASANDAFTQSLWASSALVLVLGVPFLWWLSRVFRRAEP